MPSNETAKTESARKHRRIIWALVLVGFLALVIWIAAMIPFLVLTSSSSSSETRLRTDKRTYQLEPATTKQAIQKGLSDTPSLAADRGMLFVYPNTQERCFWMKGMRYNLDIIWTDEAKKITAIEHNVSPATYPNTFCHEGRYVIELNAGEAVKAGLKQGQALKF